MPRGHRNKNRARERRRHAREESLRGESNQASAAVEEVPTTSSSFSESGSQCLSAAGTTSSTTESGPAVAGTGANAGASNQEISGCPQSQLTTLDKKVISLASYMLSKYQLKESFTRAEMLRDVVQLYKHRYGEILRKSSEYLELIFGLDLKEMDPNKHIFVLVNKLELRGDGSLHDVPKTGLLMMILGVIFTRGNRATEEQIWEVLNGMGFYAGENHIIFGEPRNIMENFLKQKYLVYQKVPNSSPPQYEFLWGPRAHAETNKMKVLNFLCKFHYLNPVAFPAWYEEALKDEEEKAQARVQARAQSSAKAEARSKTFASNKSGSK